MWQVAQNSFSLLLSYFVAQYVLIIVVYFCEKIFYFSRNDIFRSAAQICKFLPRILPELCDLM